MKRRFALLLTLSLCALTACGGAGVSPSVGGAGASASSDSIPPASAGIFSSASLESGLEEGVSLQNRPAEVPITFTVEKAVYEDAAYADDGTETAKYRYELPTLTARRADGTEVTGGESSGEKRALAAVKTFNAQFADWAGASAFPDTAAAARQNYAWWVENGADGYLPYDEELTYTSFQTEHLVSISAVCYSYTGGAHGNTALLGWTFDLDSGAFLSPVTLAAEEQVFQSAVAAELARQAQTVAASYQMEPAEYFQENYEEIIADWPSYAVSFSEDGMTVGFSPYEIACYAAGPQCFTLGYDFLLPYFSDQGLTLLGLAPEATAGR